MMRGGDWSRRVVVAAVAFAAVPAWSGGALAQSASGEEPAAGAVRFVLGEGSEARYRVREQLAGLEFPNDAVGATSQVTGQVVLDGNGAVVAASSRFDVDLASLKTDQDRRDNYVRRNTLETEQYPTAVLVPTEIRGLASPLPTSGAHSFELVGDLTIHGVTTSSVWNVDAVFGEGTITGTARTEFTFEEHGIQKPRLARVLSVADQIRLELDFRLSTEGGPAAGG